METRNYMINLILDDVRPISRLAVVILKKSALIMIVSLILVFISYFSTVLRIKNFFSHLVCIRNVLRFVSSLHQENVTDHTWLCEFLSCSCTLAVQKLCNHCAEKPCTFVKRSENEKYKEKIFMDLVSLLKRG